ncbi:MAG: DUF1992 domain-containing protein [Deltaproteobacteria bacterium]|nr:DUF1992 domain-containing protein [Deltaproteobacteria bacterium]
MFDFQKIAEQRILEAIERGELDGLPGAGSPIAYEDESRIPEDLRMAYKILKNANCVPPEVSELKEIRQAEDLLEHVKDEQEKYRLVKRLNFRIMKINMLKNRRADFEIPQHYCEKLADKLQKKAE